MNTSQTDQSPLVERARGLLAKITSEPLTLIRYEHGGGRLYKQRPAAGERSLIADFYEENDREFYRAAPDLVEGLCKENEALRECLELTAREAHRMGGYHAPNFVSFEDCQKTVCVRARAALTQPEIETES